MHILIATDGSEISERAVDQGIALAARLGASVTALTVTEGWSVFDMAQKARTGSTNPVEEYDRLAAQHAAAILDRVAEKAKAAGVSCETVHRPDSNAAEAIVAEADRRKSDMIAMASHGRRGLDRMIIGSVTMRVLALTERPVLVYR